MKITKFAQTVKWYGRCAEYRVKDNTVWLSNGYAIYHAVGIPFFYGKEQAKSILSLDEKQAEKILFTESDEDDIYNVAQMNLSDFDAMEKDTEKLTVSAVVGEKMVYAIKARDGECLFYDADLLSPVMDTIKKSAYISLKIRKTESGQRYIAVKDGMILLAALMPMQFITERYLSDLADFQAVCTDQFFRERAREIAKEKESEEEQC